MASMFFAYDEEVFQPLLYYTSEVDLAENINEVRNKLQTLMNLEYCYSNKDSKKEHQNEVEKRTLLPYHIQIPTSLNGLHKICTGILLWSVTKLMPNL